MRNIPELFKDIKLLYVENKDDDRESTLEILKYYFDDIKVAKDGIEGLELYKKHHLESKEFFHIVLSDIEMPKMNGIDMSEKIKNLNQNQPILLLTAYTNKKNLSVAINIGVDKFISKPFFSADDLLNPLIELSKKIKLKIELEKSNFLLEQKNKIIDENVLMTVSDLSGKIVDISKAYLDLIGYPREKVIGHNYKIFRNEESKKEVIKNLWKTVLGDNVWTGNLKNNKYSGEPYWISSTISPLYDMKHQKIGYTSISQNITNTKRLESLSITDSLTDIHNRRYFDYSLKREFKHSTWKKEKFALLILDVDYFKGYNDFYGHFQGDKVLIKIAAEIRRYVGVSIENVFRIGGEEFAIFILNTTDKEVNKIALDMVSNIESLNIKHERSAVSDFVTISIGVANVDGSTNYISDEDIYKLADTNLYKAKESGRNRIFSDSSEYSMNSLKTLDTLTKLPNRESLIRDLSMLQDESMLIILHINQINYIQTLFGVDSVNQMVTLKAQQLGQIIIDSDATLYSLNIQEFAILVTSRSLFDKYLTLLKYSILTNFDECTKYIDGSKDLVPDFTAGVSYGILNLFKNSDIVLQEAIMSKKNLIIYKNNQTTL
ncbi:MAG: diguanylate cyclase (GGDEF)-like protein/PAS domain S-box-containing protein [Sulfurimonas sp.]|jgi:diguanylate cyclase (GGDEF)-like protein/PAS domain S-box-containing protein